MNRIRALWIAAAVLIGMALPGLAQESATAWRLVYDCRIGVPGSGRILLEVRDHHQGREITPAQESYVRQCLTEGYQFTFTMPLTVEWNAEGLQRFLIEDYQEPVAWGLFAHQTHTPFTDTFFYEEGGLIHRRQGPSRPSAEVRILDFTPGANHPATESAMLNHWLEAVQFHQRHVQAPDGGAQPAATARESSRRLYQRLHSTFRIFETVGVEINQEGNEAQIRKLFLYEPLPGTDRWIPARVRLLEDGQERFSLALKTTEPLDAFPPVATEPLLSP